MKKKLILEGLIIGVILLLVGTNITPVLGLDSEHNGMRNLNHLKYSYDTVNRNRPYWIIGTITDLRQVGDEIEFKAIHVMLIHFLPFTLFTQSNTNVSIGKNYIGIITLHFVFAWANYPALSMNVNVNDNNQEEILPGKVPPEIVFGFITNLNTIGNITFTTIPNKTWRVNLSKFSIVPYNYEIELQVVLPIYFRFITPRVVFIVAKGFLEIS
jgi:hypothetical protein